MAKHTSSMERRALHRISTGLHSVSRTRELSRTERAVYVMAQRALTPELSTEAVLAYLGR